MANGITVLFWDLQWSSHEYPFDCDFYVTEGAYADLELFGDKWDSYCNPEVILKNQKYTTNDGEPLTFTNWIHPRWIPNGGGTIPERFIAKSWKVIIYNDANRTSVENEITGNFTINDIYLIDKQGWFVSKILDVTPYKNIGINQSVDIFCEGLQPLVSYLKITVQKNQELPITIFDEYLDDEVRDKTYTIAHTFGSAGLYTIKYNLRTPNTQYIDNWCPSDEDYIVEEESFVEVGVSS